MLSELQTWLQNWWQNATPDLRTWVQQGSLMLVALLGGQVLGSIVRRLLHAKNFDVALRVPGSSAGESRHGFTPTFFAVFLVRLTVWAGAAWWLARQYGWDDLASALGKTINRTWALATVLVAILALGSVLAGRVIDCLKAGSENLASRNGSAASHRSVAGAVGAAIYGLVALLALLMTADFFGWPLTQEAAKTLWQLAQHLLVAGAALLIGYLGAGWARELVTLEGATSPEKRAALYTGLGIVTITTVLAIAVLLTSAGVLFGLAAMAILGLCLWLVRGDLPDIAAGLQLRANRVNEVWFDGAPWQISKVGFVSTEVSRGGAFNRVQNRLVLEARMHGQPAEAARR